MFTVFVAAIKLTCVALRGTLSVVTPVFDTVAGDVTGVPVISDV
jgi:hypothetical protein